MKIIEIIIESYSYHHLPWVRKNALSFVPIVTRCNRRQILLCLGYGYKFNHVTFFLEAGWKSFYKMRKPRVEWDFR